MITSLRTWWLLRRVPIVVGFVVVATGLAFSFFWLPVTGRGSGWAQSGDLWSTFRSAQYVAWGDIGDISRAITLPGIAVLLAPVALVAEKFGLVAAYPKWLPHPTAWPVLAPYAMALGTLVLLPLDELASRHGVRGARRVVLCVAEGIALWPLVAMWGHPEDALAVGASVKCLLAWSDRRWRAMGWWFGVAVVMQPMVLPLFPLVVLGMVPRARDRVWFGLRSAVPSVVLLAIPLEQHWHRTMQAIINQANYPSLDHPTPWMAIAPVLQPAHWATTHFAVRTSSGFVTRASHHLVGAVVGTGPGHLIALALAVLVGVYAWRRPPTSSGLLWLAAFSLSLRCAFESVEDPYYVWPALALLLIGAAAHRGWRFPAALVTAAAVTIFTEFRLGPWSWYLPVMGLLAVALAVGWPAGGLRAGPAIGRADASEEGPRYPVRWTSAQPA